MAKKKPVPLAVAAASASPSFPASGQTVWVRGYNPSTGTGTIHLRGYNDGSAKTRAWIQPLGDPTPLPAKFDDITIASVVNLDREGMTNDYSKENVSISPTFLSASTGLNMQWRIAAYDDASNDKVGSDEVIEFRAVAPTLTVQVPATACIWFAYATGGVGPEGETVAGNAPVEIRIPAGGWKTSHRAAQARFTADGSIWRRGPTLAFDANGDAAHPEPLEPTRANAYKALGGPKISDEPHRKNTLVAVRRVGVGTDAKEEAIGRGPTTLPLEDPISHAIATGFFLGCHDGLEWTNNSGAVNVTVEWM